MNRLLSTLLALTAAISSAAAGFNAHFADSTLRIDYILGGTAAQPAVMFDRASVTPQWAGRRGHLDELHLRGNGRLTMTDAATGDTLYRTSFSTLFQEWLGIDEAKSLARAFRHTVLAPLPLHDADLTLELSDARQRTIAQHRWRYSPADVLVSRPEASPLPHRLLHGGADPADAIDVAILAEGYTAAEMDSFYVHARRAVDEILSYEPFHTYADRFNFVAVASPSADSGVSVPRLGDWRDTAVGSHFSTFYSDRYLTSPEVGRMHDLLRGIPYEHIIILANTDEYGGGGIYNDYLLTTARHPLFRPVVVHEFGHSFAGLADEYFYEGDVMEDTYPTTVEPWEPNITTKIDFPSKWADMLSEPGVGLFEGGGYSFKGVWRPADECRMRNNSYPTFCPVCRRAIARTIEFHTR